MKNLRKKSFLSIFIIVSMMFALVYSTIGNVQAKKVEFLEKEQFKFTSDDVLSWIAHVGAGSSAFLDTNSNEWPAIPTTVTKELVDSKKVIPLYMYNDGKKGEKNVMATNSASSFLSIQKLASNEFYIPENIMDALGVELSDITVTNTLDYQGVGSVEYTVTFSKEDGKIVGKVQNKEKIEEEIAKKEKAYIEYLNSKGIVHGYSELTSKPIPFDENYINGVVLVSQTAKIGGNSQYSGREYKFALGGTGEWTNYWVLVEANSASKINEFNTELSYTDTISKKETQVKETYIPSFDKNDIEKDADVTAIIRSTTNNNIGKVDGVVPGASKDAPNANGWYYLNNGDKKVIAKDYKFDDYDNLTNNGIVPKETVKLETDYTIDGKTLEDTQDVSIKWAFRIIKVTKVPEEIDKDTEKVRVEITTNLPIDETKLPEKWAFTSDEEGTTQHRVFREFNKGENFDGDIELTAHGRSDKDSTHVTIDWTLFNTLMEYVSNSKTTPDDGKTFLPQYHDNDVDKKDLDVTVRIKSRTDEDIVSTNGVELTSDGKPNSEGWYYPDTNDKKVIAKDYPFDKYDNTKDNGKVKETVKLVGAEGGEDTQTPSIEWTFRRKSVKEKTNANGSVTVTITFNLPIDTSKIPDGWSPVYDEDGVTCHKIEKTIKKGEDYDADVPVKQNGTDATVITHVTKKWQPAIIPQTGETLAIVVVSIIILLGIAGVSYRKFKK